MSSHVVQGLVFNCSICCFLYYFLVLSSCSSSLHHSVFLCFSPSPRVLPVFCICFPWTGFQLLLKPTFCCGSAFSMSSFGYCFCIPDSRGRRVVWMDGSNTLVVLVPNGMLGRNWFWCSQHWVLDKHPPRTVQTNLAEPWLEKLGLVLLWDFKSGI